MVINYSTRVHANAEVQFLYPSFVRPTGLVWGNRIVYGAPEQTVRHLRHTHSTWDEWIWEPLQKVRFVGAKIASPIQNTKILNPDLYGRSYGASVPSSLIDN